MRQMTDRTLNALKGWPNMAAVDFSTEFDETITDEVPPGAVVHLNASNGKYLLGVGTDAVMPLFNFASSLDPDVFNDGGDPATEKGIWVPVNPTGQAMSLVGMGAYELVSTHFKDDESYPPNTPLTSTKSPDADAGKLQPGVLYTDMIVGIVSRGVVDNGYGTDAVAFWPFPVFPS